MKNKIIQYLKNELEKMDFAEFLTNLFLMLVAIEASASLLIAIFDNRSRSFFILLVVMALGAIGTLWFNLKRKKFIRVAVVFMFVLYFFAISPKVDAILGKGSKEQFDFGTWTKDLGKKIWGMPQQIFDAVSKAAGKKD